MWRNALGVVTGIVVWVALVTAGGLAMRTLWTAYAAADTPAMTFDLAMKVARLTLSSVALIIASIAAVRVARRSRYVALAFGVVLLIAFIPIHYELWPKFPIWYHLTFLISLVVLPQLTAWVAGQGEGATAPDSAAS